mmetsp:Transcript_55867/g.130776  ORF Transcript_55867/g.130776 Transcript_55867/m.130776 type:complete len:146 (+) Transcript_55867:93-530(+)
MTNVPLGRGGWYYELGYRLCVSGLKEKTSKTTLQTAFGEYGHVIKLEQPKVGVAYLTYQEREDAEDAKKYLDGESIDGQRVRVTWADKTPPQKPLPPGVDEAKKESRSSQDLRETSRRVERDRRSPSRRGGSSRSRSRRRHRRPR